MKKSKALLGCIVIIGAVLLSGCIGDNSSSYPSEIYREKKVIDVEMKYDPPIFYFGDVVQDNGSINTSKTVNWTLIIINNGTEQEDVRFEILQFPPELMVWSTELKIFEVHTAEAGTEVKKGELFNITYTLERTLEYDYYYREFDSLWIEDISVNTSIEFVVSITFNETVAWSYSPDTTYVGFFEIRKRTIDPKCWNTCYGEEIIPFVVRT